MTIAHEGRAEPLSTNKEVARSWRLRATIGASAPELLRTFTEIIIAASLKRPFVTALSKIGSTKVKSAGLLAIRCGRSVFAAVAKAFGMRGKPSFAAVARRSRAASKAGARQTQLNPPIMASHC